MIVQSFGQLQSVGNPYPHRTMTSGSSLNMYGLSQAYGQLYRTQPNIRICVDFLARNIAQLGLPVYRRVSDTDRVRLIDHDLAKWLKHPNPAKTRYTLIEDLMTDLGIYFRAYWLKVRVAAADGRPSIGLVRLPPDEVSVEGPLIPTMFVWTPGGMRREFEPSEIVHFSGYQFGISPLETLRRVLSEEQSAGEYRESFWGNAARHEGIIERPPTAPKWTPTQKQSWREQWQEGYAAGGSRAGAVAVLEDGMVYKQTSFSAKDSEFVAGGKLRREVCAAAYHIPQPMVGILDHATFSNIKEQHKHTYQDTLGPWMESIQQEIERQLLPECEDQDNVYIEFNIDAKLSGTPEERAASLQLSVGKPWRTVNEARALENLPRDPDPASDKVAPQQGGPATAKQPDETAPRGETMPPDAMDEDESEAHVAPILQAHRARQMARLAKVPTTERAVAFWGHLDRWTNELVSDLTPIVGPDRATGMADKANSETLTQLETEALHA
jgi:HK97 family phage portal protein